MKYTSAEAAKVLRKLNEDYSALLNKENQSRSFLASGGEDVESVRPEYSFAQTQGALIEIEGRIRKLQHAINVFNTTTAVPGFDMTVDQMLVLIPQLTGQKNRLYSMKSVLPKTREKSGYGSNSSIIDYRYANYEIADVEKEYERIADLLARAQTALDALNNSATLDIDL